MSKGFGFDKSLYHQLDSACSLMISYYQRLPKISLAIRGTKFGK